MFRVFTFSVAAAMVALLAGAFWQSFGYEPGANQPSKDQTMALQRQDSIRGKTIRWTWTEGPVAGTTHEHDFHDDGTVVWRVMNGPNEGHTAQEKEYAAERVADDVYVISYLAASGYTLTVALNFGDNTMVGFASNEKEWYPGKGTFEIVNQ